MSDPGVRLDLFELSIGQRPREQICKFCSLRDAFVALISQFLAVDLCVANFAGEPQLLK